VPTWTQSWTMVLTNYSQNRVNGWSPVPTISAPPTVGSHKRRAMKRLLLQEQKEYPRKPGKILVVVLEFGFLGQNFEVLVPVV